MTYLSRLEERLAAGPALCVGLDPHPAVLTEWGFPDSPAGVEAFGERALEAITESGAGIAKVQVALFERHGVAGMDKLHTLCSALRDDGVLVIGDAKRGDIGSTMAAYAQAWLTPGADFEVDALTVNPYLGVGALDPVFELAIEHDKGVFVLAATSNPEAATVQSAQGIDGVTVAAQVLNEVAALGQSSAATPARVGVVVGATIDQGALGIDLSPHACVPVLAPGYGAQGASLNHARSHFPHSRFVIAVAGRSLLSGPADGLATRIGLAGKELGQ